MHPQDYLIPAAAADAAAGGSATTTRGRQPTRAGWKRKVTSLANNRLIENFSEFLASRNVITNNTNDAGDSCLPRGHYDKLVEHHQSSSRPSSFRHHQNHFHHTSKAAATTSNNNKFQETSRRTKRANQQPHNRTMSMLGALLSPKSKSHHRRTILLSLIRAPTVLAALFSLLLVVTLIVFYALSFSHHQALLLTSQQQQALSNSTTWSFFSRPDNEAAPQTVTSQGELAKSSRRISSRDLPAELKTDRQQQTTTTTTTTTTEDVSDDGADDDDDDDGDSDAAQIMTDNENELPEGLSRALSVQTECGQFMGSAEDNGVVFRQIPYASPPVGERRWQRPRPIWLDPERCNVSGPGERSKTTKTTKRSRGEQQQQQRRRRRARRERHCAQLNPITNRFAGQEDCLYLDIYLPRLDQTKQLPVMVYIHGGFLAFGSSYSNKLNWMKAKPSARLAAELDVILVAFNYRLQALGFMTPPQLESLTSASSSATKTTTTPTKSDQQQGNFGLWDQLTALNWIKRNIESFGGDPNNIVLFGPDSASSLVWALVGHHRQRAASVPSVAAAATTGAHSAAGLRNLFRAAWLTNPTIFYDLPYELASQHYQRLFQNNQSICLELGPEKSNATRPPAEGDETDNRTTTRLKDCLMELSAEQVMRHYLGNDHPSYRLDDQNSLPIHGIFVDQFVTIDGELVRDSFPFRGASSGADSDARPASANTDHGCNADTSAGQSANSETNLPKLSSSLQPLSETSHYAKGDSMGAPAADQRRNPNGTNRSHDEEEGEEAASICGHKDEQPIVRQPTPPPPPDEWATIDLLIGSTAQAVEHWPCPRNINQWSWDDFKRYVATSLNSFATDLYRRASGLYDVPKLRSYKTNSDEERKASGGASPAWTYLTMVSDIRQICPINELADNLRMAKGLSVHRYIVESAPTGLPSPSATVSTKEADHLTRVEARSSGGGGVTGGTTNNDHYANLDYLPSGRPKFAYHTKDLAAFFGYEFDPTFRPQPGDLKFQTKIRQMVRQFVHKQPAANNGGDAAEKQIAILDGNGATRYEERYRDTVCSMWRRHLRKSYAWIS